MAGVRYLFITNASTSNLLSLNYNAANSGVAQSYTCTETGDLGMIYPYMTRVGTPSGNLYLEVYSGDVFGSGTLLGTSTTVNSMEVFVNTGASYHQFYFNTSVPQVSGQMYWINFCTDGPTSASNYINVKGSTTSTYAGGSGGLSTSSNVWSGIAGDIQLAIYNKASDIYTNYLTGNDTTGSGTISYPYQTLYKALSVQLQGDTIKMMENEVVSSGVVFPVRAGRQYPNVIMGVNSLGVEDGTMRSIIGSGVATFSNPAGAGNTYSWLFKNLEFNGFTGTLFNTSATWNYGGSTFYNCKFKNLTQISTANLSSWTTFQKCVFEDIANASSVPFMGNTSYGSSFINCVFRRCSTNATLYNLLAAWNLVDCIFVDCSSPRYGPTAVITMMNLVIDRYTFTGTGNVDNVMLGFNYSSTNYTTVYKNILVTNVQFSNNYPGGAYRLIGSFNTSTGVVATVENVAYWNVNATPYKRIALMNTIDLNFDNSFIALTESPWKNDDGVIANPMACYEYKDSYLWRKKNQLLNDISGWSYPL